MLLTKDINKRVAEDTEFAKAVSAGIARFLQGDWGDVDSEDRKTNDINKQSLQTSGSGFTLGSYGAGTDKFWIIEDGQATTVLFPSEY